MKHAYTHPTVHFLPLVLALSGLLVPTGTVQAQAPTLTAISPTANARAANRSSVITATFSQPLTSGSAAALKVYSTQRGGLRTRGTTPAVLSGNTLTFTPSAYDFRPGEIVSTTVTTAAANGAGALAQPKVVQFTAAVGGTGRGIYTNGQNPTLNDNPLSAAVGDVDGDGDLDALIPNAGNIVSVRFNNGAGFFSSVQGNGVGVGNSPRSIAVGDLDGDGDLDLLTANFGDGTVSIRLNNGAGVFSGVQNVLVGNGPRSVVLGDVDADGDMDFVVPNENGGNVAIGLNDGMGVFGNVPNQARTGDCPVSAVLGDIDGDGDLDLITANSCNQHSVSISFNTGSGVFGIGQVLPVGLLPRGVTLGDVDGDGDLDLMVANSFENTVSIRVNNGTGQFSGAQEVPVGSNPQSVVVGDVDADGDLDLLTANGSDNVASVRLNNGAGLFSLSPDANVGDTSSQLVMADIDGDSDLDLLITPRTSLQLVVRFNGGTGPLSTHRDGPRAAFSMAPNPARGAVHLTGLPAYQTVQVLDGVGRTVATATASAAGTAELSGTSPGFYVVRAGTQSQRLAVE